MLHTSLAHTKEPTIQHEIESTTKMSPPQEQQINEDWLSLNYKQGTKNIMPKG